MVKRYGIDIAAWLAIFAWVASSIYLALNGNADLFQRLGGIGIVLGVVYYAMIPPPVLHPIGQIEAQALRDKTTIEIAKGVVSANYNTNLLAASFGESFRDQGKSAPETVSALAVPAEEILNSGEDFFTSVERIQNAEAVAAGMLFADKEAARAERVRFLTQATLVVAGTLQASFGSMITSTS
jgi:hypothetical protein